MRNTHWHLGRNASGEYLSHDRRTDDPIHLVLTQPRVQRHVRLVKPGDIVHFPAQWSPTTATHKVARVLRERWATWITVHTERGEYRCRFDHPAHVEVEVCTLK